MRRVVVVLGYSDGDTAGLHPVCAARLARAAELTTDDDVVVLSGWSRHPERRSEAELMAEAWSGPALELVLDPNARSTAENAANAIDDVVRAGADVVVVVTSAVAQSACAGCVPVAAARSRRAAVGRDAR